MLRFCLTLLFCCLSVSPSHDSRAFLLAMSILSFLLPGLIPAWLDHDLGYHLTDFWSGSICSLYWHSVVPIQNPGMFRARYLGVFFCLLMSALTSVTCLRFLHELLPWSHHLSPSKIRNCTKSHWKLPYMEHGSCWKLPFFLIFPNKYFILRRAETKKLVQLRGGKTQGGRILLMCINIWWGGSKEERTRIFLVIFIDRMRRNGNNLNQWNLNTRKTFFRWDDLKRCLTVSYF